MRIFFFEQKLSRRKLENKSKNILVLEKYSKREKKMFGQ